MIDAMLRGRLYAKPEERTSRSGSSYVTARMLVALGEERLFCSAIAFDEQVCRELLALDEGEAVTISGELRPKLYEARDGAVKLSLDCTVHAILTAHHARRKRRAMQSKTADLADDFGDDPAVIR
jgi:hypothetical protein